MFKRRFSQTERDNMNKSKFSDKQRIATVRAYLTEVERICNDRFGGDWESMPKELKGLPVRWDRVILNSGINTTEAGASRLVFKALTMDSVMDVI
jgi:hypothetical protein